mgnify:CR=1 FL=1
MVSQKLPRLNRLSKANLGGFLTFSLLMVILVSMVAIVLVQHQVRHLETQYAQAMQREVMLQEEQGKLILEKHHLTALARVEHLARTRLQMTLEKSPFKEKAQTIILEKRDAASTE